MNAFHNYQQKFHELWERQIPFVSVILVHSRGSAPQEQGAKMLVTGESSIPVAGTVGGGKVEAKVLDHALEMLKDNQVKTKDFVVWNLQRDVKMTCGGEVSFFFEVHFHLHLKWEIAIFGAGHVALALVPLLLNLDCHITCIDARKEWLDKMPSSPNLTIILTEDAGGEVKKLPSKAFILSLTKGHAFDLPVLKEVLSTRTPPYLGVIGSESKANVLRSDLIKAGISTEKVGSFYCPVGLPIGENTPAEIAISIAAQLLQERDLFRSKKLERSS